MTVMGVTKFERLFRLSAEIDIDPNELKRFSDFVSHKVYDILLRAEANAKWNGRDVIEPADLPVTKGLQESMHQFGKLDEALQIEPILEQLAGLPALDLYLSEETRARLPLVVGGLTVALARTLKVLDPDAKVAHTTLWDRTFQIFDLLL
ncbi:MAG: hypothetical protein JWO62_3706 [Acidimicrobiaceae bacterium]|nr:hypothetical protein [Acidimicrobiaceae bacterium]